MKCISLQPPWGWLVCGNLKDCENREWRSNFTGEVLIHQSKTWDRDAYDAIRMIDYDAYKWLVAHYQESGIGAIIGKSTFGKCTDFIKSKWFFGKFAYPCSNGILFDEPIPYRGQLSFFEVNL